MIITFLDDLPVK